MFDFGDHLVQVEMGTSALQRYSSKDTRDFVQKLLLEDPPKWGDDLIRATDQLQMSLQQEGIYLPGVLFSPAQELPADCIRVTFGIASSDFDSRKTDPITALEYLARNYQPTAVLTKDWVLDQLFIALDHIQKRKFQDAMNKLVLVYYWSSLIDYSTVRVVALLNIGGLSLLNSRSDDAYTSVCQAQVIVEKKDFHDPYLRFHTYEAMANIACLKEDYRSGGELYLRAANTLLPLGEYFLLMSTLYHSVSPLMEVGEYQTCRQVLDTIVSLASQGEEDFGNNFWVELYRISSDLANLTETELMRKNRLLQNQVRELQTKYYELARKNASAKHLMTAVIQVGSSMVQYYMGALTSGDKYYDQRTQNQVQIGQIGQAGQVAITQINEYGSNIVY